MNLVWSTEEQISLKDPESSPNKDGFYTQVLFRTTECKDCGRRGPSREAG